MHVRIKKAGFLFLGLSILAVLFMARGLFANPSVTLYGGAESVSGSLAFVETGRSKVFVDCGAFYEGDLPPGIESLASKNCSFPRDLPDAVLITHAHLDHIGRLPELFRRDFEGKIYLTEATARLAVPMLEMALRYEGQIEREWVWSRRQYERTKKWGYFKAHWNRDCEYGQMVKGKNKETFTGTIHGLEKTTGLDVSPCKVCASEEAKGISERFVTLSYGERTRIARGVHATFLEAGHIPGSASIFIEIERLGKTTRVLFSGDLGNDFSRLQRGPPPAPEADFVFVESTYGAARSGIDPLTELERFHQEIGERISDQGIVWVPAFALDRTQKILHEIEFLKKEGKIPKDTPVYCPSPLAKEITGIYHENKSSGWFKDSVSEIKDPFGWERGTLKFRLPRGEEKTKPHVLVTTSGMMDQAFSPSLLGELLPKNDVSLLIVGYQSEGTPGRKIEEGARSLETDGRSIPVKAKVVRFHCFSGHASAEQIDRWLKHIDKDVPLFLVHGEPESLKVRQNDLAEKGHSDVKIPELMKKFNLGE